jgi:hypothetical protein
MDQDGNLSSLLTGVCLHPVTTSDLHAEGLRRRICCCPNFRARFTIGSRCDHERRHCSDAGGRVPVRSFGDSLHDQVASGQFAAPISFCADTQAWWEPDVTYAVVFLDLGREIAVAVVHDQEFSRVSSLCSLLANTASPV